MVVVTFNMKQSRQGLSLFPRFVALDIPPAREFSPWYRRSGACSCSLSCGAYGVRTPRVWSFPSKMEIVPFLIQFGSKLLHGCGIESELITGMLDGQVLSGSADIVLSAGCQFLYLLHGLWGCW
jgi:hypothetical protein